MRGREKARQRARGGVGTKGKVEGCIQDCFKTGALIRLRKELGWGHVPGKAEGRTSAQLRLRKDLGWGHGLVGGSTVPGCNTLQWHGEPGRLGTQAKTTPGYAVTGTAKRA
eukprot:3717570-Rhodomonas_salina.1